MPNSGQLTIRYPRELLADFQLLTQNRFLQICQINFTSKKTDNTATSLDAITTEKNYRNLSTTLVDLGIITIVFGKSQMFASKVVVIAFFCKISVSLTFWLPWTPIGSRLVRNELRFWTVTFIKVAHLFLPIAMLWQLIKRLHNYCIESLLQLKR